MADQVDTAGIGEKITVVLTDKDGNVKQVVDGGTPEKPKGPFCAECATQLQFVPLHICPSCGERYTIAQTPEGKVLIDLGKIPIQAKPEDIYR